QMVDHLMALPEGSRLQILAPVVRGRKGEHRKLLDDIRRDGFVRVRVDGEVRTLDEPIKLDKNRQHTIEVVVDRAIVRPGVETRLADSLETALNRAGGIVLVHVVGKEEFLFSQNLACPDCGTSVEELAPRMFSFNSPFGACPSCDGLGARLEVDPELVIDPERSLLDGGIIPWTDSNSRWLHSILEGVREAYDIDPTVPLGQLPPEKLRILVEGVPERVSFRYRNRAGRERVFHAAFPGVVGMLRERHRESQSDWVRQEVEKFMTQR